MKKMAAQGVEVSILLYLINVLDGTSTFVVEESMENLMNMLDGIQGTLKCLVNK